MPEQNLNSFQGTSRLTSHHVRDLLLSPDVYASTLLVWFIDTYADPDDDPYACLHYDPQTIKDELDRLAGGEVPKLTFDKLMAAITIVTTDMFFANVKRFMPLANILAGDDFQPDELEPPDAVECAWACTEALILVPPTEQDPEPFSDEIRHYLGQVLREEGFVTAPDILKLAIGSDFTGQVATEFSDDPEMFEGIYAVQQDKTAEVEQVLKTGLRELLEQLTALPLRTGNAAELKERLRQSIK
jgi:hypothetical protein